MSDSRTHPAALLVILLRKLLFLWARYHVHDVPHNVASAGSKQSLCYVLEFRSLADRLVLEQVCRTEGLIPPQRHTTSPAPGPVLIFMQRRRGLLGYIDRTPPRQLQTLLDHCAADPNRELTLIPVSVFWGQAPRRERSPFKALFSSSWRVVGAIRKSLAILFHGRQITVQFGTPLSLSQLTRDGLAAGETHSRLVRKAARLLRSQFRATRTRLLGPDLSHRRTLVHSLISRTTVRQAIAQEATHQEQPLHKHEARARRYANEIASDMSYPAIRFMDHLLTWLWHRLYDGIRIQGLERVRQHAASHELVYVPCHRSHIDYLLLSYVLYHHGLSLPHVAAGINLNLPVIGPLLRRGGAFFLRRSFRDNPLYSAVFNEYLHTLLSRGHPIEYFVEGGRSRTGRTLPARPGLLSMTVRSFLRNPSRPLLLIPVYIGYEKVLEGKTYLGELRGQGKRRESPLDLLRTLKNLGQPYGEVHLTFGQPIDLGWELSRIEPHWQQPYEEMDPRPPWLPEVVTHLGQQVTTGINQAAVVTPLNLIATGLLASAHVALEERALIRQTELYHRLLQAIPYSSDMQLPKGDGQTWITHCEQLGMIRRQPHPQGDIIHQQGSDAVLLTYYRNNVQHLFALPSLLACLFQNIEALERQHLLRLCLTLYPYVQQELFLPWSKRQTHALLRQWLDLFVQEGLLQEEDRHYQRPAGGNQTRAELERLGQTMQPTLERFYITVALLLHAGNGQLTAAELEEQCQMLAQRLALLHGLNAPEFFDKLLFRRFIETLQQKTLLTTDQNQKLCYDNRLEEAALAAREIFSPAIRHSILLLL